MVITHVSRKSPAAVPARRIRVHGLRGIGKSTFAGASPESLRVAFAPARTVKTGKPVFHLELKDSR